MSKSSTVEPAVASADQPVDDLAELRALADGVTSAEAVEVDDAKRLAKLARAFADAPPSFISRIAAAMAEAGRVGKDGRNTDQGYDYASVEAVLEEVRRPLLERHIILLPGKPAVEETEIRSRGGTVGTSATVTVDFTFLDGLSDATLTVAGWQGQGQDYGDKAFGKAYTNAIKTFVRITWLLPTGDDPEADSPERVAKPNGAAAELPTWARPSTSARKTELGGALIPLLGRERALAVAKSVQGSLGHLPDVLVAYTKLLVDEFAGADQSQLAAGILNRRQELDEAAAVKAEAATAAADVAAQAAAEAPDPPASDDLEGDTADLPAEPPAGERPPVLEPPLTPGAAEALDEEQALADAKEAAAAAKAARPAAGTVELPAGFDACDRAGKLRELEAAGCSCPSPLDVDLDDVTSQREHLDDSCPVKGHGIPF